jgi:hypothetical protein
MAEEKKIKDQKVNRRFKKLVRESFQRHAWNMGVSHYVADIFYMCDDKLSDGHHVHAEITVDRRYLKVILKIYPEAIVDWQENGDKTVDALVAHECAHLLTQHLYDVATACYRDEGEMKDAWETLTESVGRLSMQIKK